MKLIDTVTENKFCAKHVNYIKLDEALWKWSEMLVQLKVYFKYEKLMP